MNKKEAIEKSIEHWQRMIKWAKEQNPEEEAYYSDMKDEIDEYWEGNDCALCIEFVDCRKCPLENKYGGCDDKGDNLWGTVLDSGTWCEWVKNAKKFLKQLKSLRQTRN